MAGGRGMVIAAFDKRLPHGAVLDDLTEDEAAALGREAAEAVLGPLRWRQLLGADRLDTTQVARLLGVSRQAVHKKVHGGALLGVAGRGTTWFPAWQFDLPHATVRGAVPEVLAAWAQAGGPVDAAAVLAWAGQVQGELAGVTPGEWIADGRDPGPLLAAARRAARSLAA